MKPSTFARGVAPAALLFGLAAPAFAQYANPTLTVQAPPPTRFLGQPTVITPKSNIEAPSDIGRVAHTNYEILNFAPNPEKISPDVGPPYRGYGYETPASLACVYGLATPVSGCNPNTFKTVAKGGSKLIVIVDAFHNPLAMHDLTMFSQQFGLPVPTKATFEVVYSEGVKPGENPDWYTEQALDIEYAHAMAPKAKIVLMEAPDNSFEELFQAVKRAGQLVQAAGGGEVSMSWGGSEFAAQTKLEANMVGSKVVFLSSTGDTAGTEYPSISPKVIGVGGTSISRNPATGNYQVEISWDKGGGGLSPVFTRPTYQNVISKVIGTRRGVPDISAEANPITGAWVYSSNVSPNQPWYIIGGTSLASPLMAGIINTSGKFAANSAVELSTIYANRTSKTAYYDVAYGSCGFYEGWFAVTGWDPCTGVGAPRGTIGK